MAAHEKPPPPVVVVMVLAGTLSVALFAFAVVGFFLSSWVFILVAGLALFLGLSIVQGLWRGWRGSRIFAIGMGAALVLSGLSTPGVGVTGPVLAVLGVVMIVLLLAPKSARGWFARPGSA
jgi:hypothetical protein